MFWDLAERVLNKNPCTASVFQHDDEYGDANRNKDSSSSSPLFVFVSTFNEWHESTSIEPSIEWGDEYLHITRERSKQLHPTTCRRLSSRKVSMNE